MYPAFLVRSASGVGESASGSALAQRSRLKRSRAAPCVHKAECKLLATAREIISTDFKDSESPPLPVKPPAPPWERGAFLPSEYVCARKSQALPQLAVCRSAAHKASKSEARDRRQHRVRIGGGRRSLSLSTKESAPPDARGKH